MCAQLFVFKEKNEDFFLNLLYLIQVTEDFIALKTNKQRKPPLQSCLHMACFIYSNTYILYVHKLRRQQHPGKGHWENMNVKFVQVLFHSLLGTYWSIVIVSVRYTLQ